MRLTVAAAGAVGLGGSIAAMGGCEDRESKPGGGLGERFEYDIKALAKTDPALIGYQQAEVLATDLAGAKAMVVLPDGAIAVAVDRQLKRIGGADDQFDQPITCVGVWGDGAMTLGGVNTVELRVDDRTTARWNIEGKPHVTSMAIHGDNVFVADAGNRIVWRFDRAGTLINRIGDRDASRDIEGFIVPSPLFDCAVDPSGELLWVANTGRHRLEAYSFDGEIQRTWGVASMGIEGFCGCCNPCHFAMLPDGRFITGEKGLPRVKRYSAAGEFECVVAGCETFGVQTDALTCNTPASKLGGPLVAVDAQRRVLALHPAVGELIAFAEKGATN